MALKYCSSGQRQAFIDWSRAERSLVNVVYETEAKFVNIGFFRSRPWNTVLYDKVDCSAVYAILAISHNICSIVVVVGACVVCVFSSHPFWTSSSLDVPAGVTQEEGHTGFLIHLPSAVRALIFVARRIQPFLSLVDREVEFCVLTMEPRF